VDAGHQLALKLQPRVRMVALKSIAWEQTSSVSLQLKLAEFNRQRLTPSFHDSAFQSARLEQTLCEQSDLQMKECRFVERERLGIADAVARAPSDANSFIEWFEGLEAEGPGQGHPLFPWLADVADNEQMRWFVGQEMMGESGFEDLVALTQVKLPTRAKLELARNYWDEMGQGKEAGMHGPMLARLARDLQIDVLRTEPVWEVLALSNLMVALAMHRHYAFQAIGALGVIELTAPGRATLVNQGLKRLGLSGQTRQYFALHATLDRRHSAAWNREVIAPLIRSNPALARPIAEGALMRLRAGERAFERYTSVLGLKTAFANAPTETRRHMVC